MRSKFFLYASAIAAIAAAALPAAAAEILPSGYATSGVSGGYNDSTGQELIDGVIADRHYPSDLAPYVGWQNQSTITIGFTFAAAQAFGSLVVWVDDFGGRFGVTAPAGVSAVVGGTTYSSFAVGAPLDAGFTYPIGYPGGASIPGGGTPYVLSLAGAAGDAVQLTVQSGGQWTFLSEVEFFTPAAGGGAVPEPGAWALMILGFAGAGAALRRWRAVAAAA